jgi:hypothetical protein
MTQKKDFTIQPVDLASLGIRILLGGVIALVVIATFVVPIDEPNPEWGKFWMIRPLIITPLAGAMGGLCYYFITHLYSLSGWKKVLSYILSIVIYIIGLWLGIVLGLAGTLWN